jgi:hypothetical protein
VSGVHFSQMSMDSSFRVICRFSAAAMDGWSSVYRCGSCKFDLNQIIFPSRPFKTYVRLPGKLS